MRFLIVILLFLNSFGFAQKDLAEVYGPVERMPEYPGGMKELMKFIASSVKYPKEAQKKKITGRTMVKFVVDSLGRVVNPEVALSSGDGTLDKEALRVVNSMPRWNPGTLDGKPVKVLFNIPIKFDLK
ncbi:MAG TPA: energy transducer TonB [Bacteroidia bacterium]|jgi:protein TonB|nr:energy transducer TonB [Bacteroidia bacterium]